MKQFDTIAKMSVGALLTILVSVGGQYILNNNAKDKCRLNPKLNLIYMDSFIGDAFDCRSYLWCLRKIIQNVWGSDIMGDSLPFLECSHGVVAADGIRVSTPRSPEHSTKGSSMVWLSSPINHIAPCPRSDPSLSVDPIPRLVVRSLKSILSDPTEKIKSLQSQCNAVMTCGSRFLLKLRSLSGNGSNGFRRWSQIKWHSVK